MSEKSQEKSKIEVKDLEFEAVVDSTQENLTITTYRSKHSYFKSIRFFCVKWPKANRVKAAKLGVCRRAKPAADPKELPDEESERTWLWNLETKQLEDSRDGPPYKPFPAGDPDFEVPELFYMILDMDRGTLNFAMPEKKDLGVAFDKLDGNLLFITYVEIGAGDEAGKLPAKASQVIGRRQSGEK